MVANPIQLLRDLSFAEFHQRYGGESNYGRELFEARRPQGLVCPQCEASAHSTFAGTGFRYWQCTASDLQARNKPTPRRVRRNRCRLPRRRALLGGKHGRGSGNNCAFVISVSTGEAGRPRTAVIELLSAFTTAALTDWAQRRLVPSAEVYSDGLNVFWAVVPWAMHISSSTPVAVVLPPKLMAHAVSISRLATSNASSMASSRRFISPSTPSATWVRRLCGPIVASVWKYWCHGSWWSAAAVRPARNASGAMCRCLAAETRR